MQSSCWQQLSAGASQDDADQARPVIRDPSCSRPAHRAANMAKGKKAKSYLGKAASFAVGRVKKKEGADPEQQTGDTPRGVREDAGSPHPLNSSSSSSSHLVCSSSASGLHNLGNTCFFNSALQLLLACAPLQQQLLAASDTTNATSSSSDSGALMNGSNSSSSGAGPVGGGGSSSSGAGAPSKGPLGFALQQAFLHTSADADAGATTSSNSSSSKAPPSSSSSGGAYNPQSLLSAVCCHAPQFRGRQQHDSHELLRILVDGLQMEEKRARDLSRRAASTSSSGGIRPQSVTATPAEGTAAAAEAEAAEAPQMNGNPSAAAGTQQRRSQSGSGVTARGDRYVSLGDADADSTTGDSSSSTTSDDSSNLDRVAAALAGSRGKGRGAGGMYAVLAEGGGEGSFGRASPAPSSISDGAGSVVIKQGGAGGTAAVGREGAEGFLARPLSSCSSGRQLEQSVVGEDGSSTTSGSRSSSRAGGGVLSPSSSSSSLGGPNGTMHPHTTAAAGTLGVGDRGPGDAFVPTHSTPVRNGTAMYAATAAAPPAPVHTISGSSSNPLARKSLLPPPAPTSAGDTRVDAVFGGVLVSQVVCTACQYVSVNYEPFLDLSLSVPGQEGGPLVLKRKASLLQRLTGRGGGGSSKAAAAGAGTAAATSTGEEGPAGSSDAVAGKPKKLTPKEKRKAAAEARKAAKWAKKQEKQRAADAAHQQQQQQQEGEAGRTPRPSHTDTEEGVATSNGTGGAPPANGAAGPLPCVSPAPSHPTQQQPPAPGSPMMAPMGCFPALGSLGVGASPAGAAANGPPPKPLHRRLGSLGSLSSLSALTGALRGRHSRQGSKEAAPLDAVSAPVAAAANGGGGGGTASGSTPPPGEEPWAPVSPRGSTGTLTSFDLARVSLRSSDGSSVGGTLHGQRSVDRACIPEGDEEAAAAAEGRRLKCKDMPPPTVPAAAAAAAAAGGGAGVAAAVSSSSSIQRVPVSAGAVSSPFAGVASQPFSAAHRSGQGEPTAAAAASMEEPGAGAGTPAAAAASGLLPSASSTDLLGAEVGPLTVDASDLTISHCLTGFFVPEVVTWCCPKEKYELRAAAEAAAAAAASGGKPTSTGMLPADVSSTPVPLPPPTAAAAAEQQPPCSPSLALGSTPPSSCTPGGGWPCTASPLYKRVSFSGGTPEVRLVPGSVEQRGTPLSAALAGLAAFTRPLTWQGAALLLAAKLGEVVGGGAGAAPQRLELWLAGAGEANARAAEVLPGGRRLPLGEVALPSVVQRLLGEAQGELVQGLALLVLDCLADILEQEGGLPALQAMTAGGLQLLPVNPGQPWSNAGEVRAEEVDQYWRVQGHVPPPSGAAAAAGLAAAGGGGQGVDGTGDGSSGWEEGGCWEYPAEPAAAAAAARRTTANGGTPDVLSAGGRQRVPGRGAARVLDLAGDNGVTGTHQGVTPAPPGYGQQQRQRDGLRQEEEEDEAMFDMDGLQPAAAPTKRTQQGPAASTGPGPSPAAHTCPPAAAAGGRGGGGGGGGGGGDAGSLARSSGGSHSSSSSSGSGGGGVGGGGGGRAFRRVPYPAGQAPARHHHHHQQQQQQLDQQQQATASEPAAAAVAAGAVYTPQAPATAAQPMAIPNTPGTVTPGTGVTAGTPPVLGGTPGSLRRSSLARRSISRQARKGYRVYLAPQVLLLHLKRFNQDAKGKLSKLDTPVKFDFTLDLTPFMALDSPDLQQPPPEQQQQQAGASGRDEETRNHNSSSGGSSSSDRSSLEGQGLSGPTAAAGGGSKAAADSAAAGAGAAEVSPLLERQYTHLSSSTGDASSISGAAGPTSSSSRKVQGVVYDLVGVVVHMGSMKSGHYVAYVKRAVLDGAADSATAASSAGAAGGGSGTGLFTSALNRATRALGGGGGSSSSGPEASSSSCGGGREQWYYISDCTVKPVPRSEVAAAQAYMLMYVRCRP